MTIDSNTLKEHFSNKAIPTDTDFSNLIDLADTGQNAVTDNKNGTIEVNGNSITPADDSKVVHSTDMRKPASDVVGLEDVSTSVYQSQLASGTDIHKVTKDGIYPLGFSYVNFMDSYSHWGTLQVINNNAVIIHIVRIETGIWLESYSGTPAVWTAWHKLSSDDKVAHLSGANNFDTVPTYGTNNKPFAINDNGATSARPTTGISAGYQYFDTSLNKPVWYTGKNWVDSTGTTV
ncbi:hypothetical protein [Gluconobacter oxydans]|uniref:hypothetical protein n=1 Tax=Gluconobacter oxydans TaxID=442 RepID=UPI00209FF521|nr:hypothetical protein [Gluconobacter oxydans]MCP1250083.1 hypothetical protein [Gluconobacter oxydans]